MKVSNPIRILFPLNGAACLRDWPAWWPIAASEKFVSFGNALFFHGSEQLARYDETTARWECATDPLGKTSLFYGTRDDQLAVSSSLHELCLALDAWDVDQQMVAEYLSTGSVFSFQTERTFIAGVRQIGPGGRLIYQNGTFRIERSELFKVSPRQRFAEFHEAVPLVRGALDEAVTSAIHEHQSVACLFSGGVDSCAIAATSIKLEPVLGHRTVLLNAGNNLGTKEELFLRQEVCDFFRRDSSTVDFSPDLDLLAVLKVINRRTNFPVGCQFSAIFEAIGEYAQKLGCTLMLSGDGGDELFGNKAQAVPVMSKDEEGLLGPFHEECQSISARLRANLQDQLNNGWRLADYWRFRQALLVPSYEPNFDYSQALRSIQAASPFLALPVFEAACSLLEETRSGFDDGTLCKPLLRESVADRLPGLVAYHRKIGSSDETILNHLLTTQWEQVIERLTSSSLQRTGIVPAAEILNRQWFRKTSANWFRLVMLAIWIEQLEGFRSQFLLDLQTSRARFP